MKNLIVFNGNELNTFKVELSIILCDLEIDSDLINF